MDYPQAKLLYFYGGSRELKTDEGVQVLPVEHALKALGKLIKPKDS